jgi:hypothetical protein
MNKHQKNRIYNDKYKLKKRNQNKRSKIRIVNIFRQTFLSPPFDSDCRRAHLLTSRLEFCKGLGESGLSPQTIALISRNSDITRPWGVIFLCGLSL